MSLKGPIIAINITLLVCVNERVQYFMSPLSATTQVAVPHQPPPLKII